MKRHLPLLAAALLTSGLFGASGSATAAPIEYLLSGANAAASEFNAIQQIDLGDDSSTAPRAIADTLLAYDIQRLSITELKLSHTSLIAIASITEANIEDYQIAGAITQITA